MNREIKFRAWDKKHGKMIYSNNVLSQFCLGLIKDNGGKFETNCTQEPKCREGADRDTIGYGNCDALIFMQYTGLPDKNGKEIYEGDIVKIGNLSKQVFMRLGCWFAEMGKELGYYGAENVEVIGNIYENKELLK